MKHGAKLAAAVGLALCVAAQTACDTEDEGSGAQSTYDVTVSWEISGLQTCEHLLPASAPYDGELLEFDEVSVTVWVQEGDEEPLQTPVRQDCEDHTYTIRGLAAGTYFVTMEAWATIEEGADAGLGEELPYFQGSMEIDVPQTVEGDYGCPLEIGTADISVAWDFEEPGGCGLNGVETVDVYLEGDNGHDRSIIDVECDTSEMLLVEDIPWDTYTLTVDGYSEDSQLTHEGTYVTEEQETEFELRPGDWEDPFWVVLESIE